MRSSSLWPALPFVLLASLPVLAVGGNVSPQQGSSIRATFRQEAVPVEAPFQRFTGTIVYDPARPAAATAALDVETGSFDIGDPAYNAEVAKPAWFDAAKHPRATFRSTAVKPTGPGRFTATGVLNIKGRALTINVPIVVRKSGKTTTFDGSFELSRKSFGIGDPLWDDVLEDKVLVTFHLVTPAG